LPISDIFHKDNPTGIFRSGCVHIPGWRIQIGWNFAKQKKQPKLTAGVNFG